MIPQLQPFPVRKKPVLHVFCPDETTVLTSFKSYLPDGWTIEQITGTGPFLPRRPCWLKEGHDYYAFLPKDHRLSGHLLASLNHQKPLRIQQDGRWYLDDGTRDFWWSLNVNFAYSITVIGKGLLVDLKHHKPISVVGYGFARGHRSEQHLCLSLATSKNALIHRLAYLTYLVSLRYQWDLDLVNQVWWKELTARCTPTWVDSVWDAIYQQWDTRNFVGVVVKPFSSSVRWLRVALNFGVPLWVLFPHLGAYSKLDGGFVMKQWEPTEQQVAASRHAEKDKLFAPRTQPLPASSPPEPLIEVSPEIKTVPPLQPPVHSKTLLPPARTPKGARWYKSWEEFFQNHNKGNAQRLESASERDKASWNSLAQNAKKFRQPGKKGPRVYVWEACNSGGFFRILQDRFDVEQMWEELTGGKGVLTQQAHGEFIVSSETICLPNTQWVHGEYF